MKLLPLQALFSWHGITKNSQVKTEGTGAVPDGPRLEIESAGRDAKFLPKFV